MSEMKWFKKIQKGCEMWFVFQDYWQLVQEYWNMEDTDEYWDAMIQACGNFIKKYPGFFPVRLIHVFIDEQERKRKGLPEDAYEYFDRKTKREKCSS